jgi:hypothetical protein
LEREVSVFELKPISPDAIPVALEKAQRYRLLNESAQSESICHDILRIDPNNKQALITLILALTDQFETGLSPRQAEPWLARLAEEYDRSYYSGIVAERAGRAHMKRQGHGFAFDAYECFLEAMSCFERAEKLRRPGDDDALLRWNACVRTLRDHSELRPRPEESYEPIVGE